MAKHSTFSTKILNNTKRHYILKFILMLLLIGFTINHIVFQTLADVCKTLQDITKNYSESL